MRQVIHHKLTDGKESCWAELPKSKQQDAQECAGVMAIPAHCYKLTFSKAVKKAFKSIYKIQETIMATE